MSPFLNLNQYLLTERERGVKKCSICDSSLIWCLNVSHFLIKSNKKKRSFLTAVGMKRIS